MQQKNQTTQSTVIEQTASNDVYESLCKKINLSTINSVIDIEQFQSNERMSESSADERIAAAVSVFLKMIQDSAQKVERLDKSLLDYHIARIDEQIGRQLDEILHNETFQEVESAWRGLKFLVDRTDFRQNVKIEVLDVSKEDLIQDFEDAPEIVQSGLYRHTYTNEYDTRAGSLSVLSFPITSLVEVHKILRYCAIFPVFLHRLTCRLLVRWDLLSLVKRTWRMSLPFKTLVTILIAPNILNGKASATAMMPVISA